MSKPLKGVVKWFNDAKGFGFIEHEETGRDVFVHYSVIEWEGFKTLKDGEIVEYELKEGTKGLHAVSVNRPNVEKSQKGEQTARKPLSASIEKDVIPTAEGNEDNSILPREEEDTADDYKVN